MVASKMPYAAAREMSSRPAPSTMRPTAASSHRARPSAKFTHGTLASPTESEFSDVYDSSDSIR